MKLTHSKFESLVKWQGHARCSLIAGQPASGGDISSFGSRSKARIKFSLLGSVVAFCGIVFLAKANPVPPAIDFNVLQSIGPVEKFTKSDSGITLTCADQSEVQISVLAPDLIRVRAAYQKPLPEQDHSWAIAKTSWEAVHWNLKEESASLRLETDELEVVVNRNPLLIEFRDAHTHQLINADQRPMAFDPKTGAVAAAKRFDLDEHFYGLGEKAARLDKRRGEFTMWTSDTPGYIEGTDPIYQSIPFYIGWQKGATYGIFFDNSYRTHFDFGAKNQEYVAFLADGGEMNYYFFQGPSMKKILSRYADLTGHMPLPPLWALGHQQSRYSYYPDKLAEAIVHRYRADDLPLDVLHLDIHYMNGYRVFTWDPQRFPDPKGFVEHLKSQGVQLVTIVDPGVKLQPPAPDAVDPTDHPGLKAQDKSYYVYNQGLAQNFFLKRTNGELYVGKVWPGKSVFVDYTIEAAARWWGDLFKAYTDEGVAGIWTDMNEPSDFLDKSGASQADVVSYDEGAHSLYAKNRNVFALGMVRATYEGLERLRPDQRPFVITRAGYAGVQRYSTMWTGDGNSTWEALALSLPMYETLGLSGEPFIGADVPGFRGTADGELMVRWYEAGFLVPLCRNHAENWSYDHEPWRFGTYYEDIVRKYLKLRYRLMPFLYTTLEEAHRTGAPLFRPLILNYQSDENTLNLDDQYMVGTDLLAAPILARGASSRRVYLPAGTWYDFWTDAPQNGGKMIQADLPLDATALFVRGGSVLPLGAEMNYVSEKPHASLAFKVYPDAAGTASGMVYEDDNVSPAYKTGAFRRTQVTYQETAAQISLTVTRQGEFHPPARNLEFILRTHNKPHEVICDGKSVAAIAAEGEGTGWSQTGEVVTLRIPDDAANHQLIIK